MTKDDLRKIAQKENIWYSGKKTKILKSIISINFNTLSNCLKVYKASIVRTEELWITYNSTSRFQCTTHRK